jgi:hypothetical protein
MPTLPMVLTATANPSRRFASLLTSKPRFRKQTEPFAQFLRHFAFFRPHANIGFDQIVTNHRPTC